MGWAEKFAVGTAKAIADRDERAKQTFRSASGEPTTNPKERKVYRTKREAQQVARELNAEAGF